MSADLLSRTLIGLLPVLLFLCTLLYLDSYKLVKLRSVMAIVACGAALAGVSYLLSGQILERTGMSLRTFSLYGAPITEELIKGLLIVALIRTHRIGFLVDAAIFGFAVGTGFAMLENIYFLNLVPNAGMATWVVRGFGTAVMHGGTTAVFAVLCLAMLERLGTVGASAGVRAFLPGFALAVVAHSAFNHLSHDPKTATLVVMIALPLLLYGAFHQSEAATRDWLAKGFDSDIQMLELINAGDNDDSSAGRYLRTLKEKLDAATVDKLVRYLQLYTELSMRAKGMLMMRENGFEIQLNDEVKAKGAELVALEHRIGKTGLRAVQPMLRMSHKDLWQLYMLKDS